MAATVENPPNVDVVPPVETDADGQQHAGGFIIRPNFQQKFKQPQVQELIHSVLVSKLAGVKYSADSCSRLTKEIVDEVKAKLKALNLPRYKYVVTAVLGEMKGEGVRMGVRCFWDQDSDAMAKDVYMNDSLFCSVAAFGVFYY